MAQTVKKPLSIEADWERSDSPIPEERACFAAIGIAHFDQWLTVAEDLFVNRVRQKVYLSAYKLAEWLAWNWWRLRWEPRRRSLAWELAHEMATIGGGFVWPNITTISDGRRILLNAQPSKSNPAEPLHYLSDVSAVVSAKDFEAAIDIFVEQVLGQLAAEKIKNSNLESIWSEVLAERNDEGATLKRRFEALLGSDPEEADPSILQRLIEDSSALGEQSVAELAADDPGLNSIEIRDLAYKIGSEVDPLSSIRLPADVLSSPSLDTPAWVRGAEVANALRSYERLGKTPISNTTLCQLVAVDPSVLTSQNPSPFSFAFDETDRSGRVALRARRETGRRFDLARLLGDRLTAVKNGCLYPATRSYTYRQKLQRSFAAEFLCPFESLLEALGGDFSDEAIDVAAEFFGVSELAVRTILVNHRLLDRYELEQETQVSLA